MSAAGELRTFSGAIPDPYKRKYAPLRDVSHSPELIQPDVMHLYNLGFGKDLAASATIMIAQSGCWPGRALQARLEHAFQNFKQWCEENGRTSSLKDFDMLKTLKMKS